ncbi:hypothetical protein KAR91_17095 [Candidatus Pacearchaeota archaeon]|nr:hypothetical protein [Candidatus Pacearchaeota archaeon]
MGMSTRIEGYIKADEKWNALKKIWDDCEKAGVEVPQEVLGFFGHDHPRSKPGLEVGIASAVEEINDECCQIWEVDISELPKDVKFIRFTNSY